MAAVDDMEEAEKMAIGERDTIFIEKSRQTAKQKS